MTSDVLRETDVWYETNDECEESQGYVKTNDGVLFGSYEGSIRESMLCAHDGIGTTSDACQGDSGEFLLFLSLSYRILCDDVLSGSLERTGFWPARLRGARGLAMFWRLLGKRATNLWSSC